MNEGTLNEGTLDRILRVVVGVALLSLIFVGPHSYWGLVGLVPLVTGIVGFCPLYRILGIGTRHAHGAHAHEGSA